MPSELRALPTTSPVNSLAASQAIRQLGRPVLSGELSQLSLPELLQTIDHARRSGVIRLSAATLTGTIWVRAGRIMDALIDGGERGVDAVYRLVLLEEGQFELDATSHALPDRIQQPTTALLLEAMRRSDEARRDAPPPHAALPDPPPLPERSLRAAHRALTMANVAAGYAREHAEPTLVATRLECTREQLRIALPALDWFAVRPGPAVVMADPTGATALPAAETTILAVAAWLRGFFATMERAFPGQFPLRRLRQCTEAVHDSADDLDILGALGFTD